MADDADFDSDPQDRPSASPSNAAVARLWESFRPLAKQAGLNLRVWLPAISTPDMKRRQIKYRARENRNGTSWQIALPRQCWQCGKTEALEERTYKRSIRRFESPLNVIFGTLGLAGMLLLPWLIFGSWKFVGLAILAMIGGGVLLGIKSWNERALLAIWSCPQHAGELSAPPMASGEDDLYVFAASETLAEAARAELQAARRRDLPGGGPARAAAARERAGNHAPDADVPPRSVPQPAPTRSALPPLKLGGDATPTEVPPPPSPPSVPVRSQLPPLKLDGEEDEPAE